MAHTNYIDVSVQIRVEQRNNCFAKNKNEWALYMRINESDWWVLRTWDNKPTQESIDSAVDLSLRTIEVWDRRPRINNRIEVIR